MVLSIFQRELADAAVLRFGRDLAPGEHLEPDLARHRAPHGPMPARGSAGHARSDRGQSWGQERVDGPGEVREMLA